MRHLIAILCILAAASAEARISARELFDQQAPPDLAKPVSVYNNNIVEDDLAITKKGHNTNTCATRTIEVPYYSAEQKQYLFARFNIVRPKLTEPRKVPVVLVLNNSHGFLGMVEGDTVEILCQNNIASIYVPGKPNNPTTMHGVWAKIQQEIATRRAAIDYVMSENKDSLVFEPADTGLSEKLFLAELDSGAIGMIAFSYGGIMSPILLGVEPRIKAAVIVGGGANIPHILSYSQNDETRALRERIFKQYNLTSPQQYTQVLMEDPNYVDNIDPEFDLKSRRDSVFQVIIEDDTSVMTYNQELLWKAYGEPKVTRVKGRLTWNPHALILVRFAETLAKDTVAFLKEKLGYLF